MNIKHSIISENRLIYLERPRSSAETAPDRLDLAMSKVEDYAKADKLKPIQMQSAVSWINEATEALEARLKGQKDIPHKSATLLTNVRKIQRSNDLSYWINDEIISKLCYMSGPIKTENLKSLVKKEALSNREQVSIITEVHDLYTAMEHSKKLSVAKSFRDWIVYTETATKGKMLERRASDLSVFASLAKKYIQTREKSRNPDR